MRTSDIVHAGIYQNPKKQLILAEFSNSPWTAFQRLASTLMTFSCMTTRQTERDTALWRASSPASWLRQLTLVRSGCTVPSAVKKRNPRAVARVLHDLLFRSSEIKKSQGNAWVEPQHC